MSYIRFSFYQCIQPQREGSVVAVIAVLANECMEGTPDFNDSNGVWSSLLFLFYDSKVETFTLREGREVAMIVELANGEGGEGGGEPFPTTKNELPSLLFLFCCTYEYICTDEPFLPVSLRKLG